MKYFLSPPLFLLILLTFLASCSSEENTSKFNNKDKFNNEEIVNTNYSNRSNEILSTEFGFYHNEAIILYLAELKKSGRKVSEQEISAAINEMSDLMVEKYPAAFGNFEMDELLGYYSEFAYVEDYGYNELKDNFISKFSNSDINSEIFLNFLNEVNSDETITYEEILEKISLESDHSDEFIVFESVLTASYSLWSTSTEYNGIDRCTKGGIIVDAGISALLWFTGPVGILGGAAGSLIYMDNCENGNP